MIAGDPFLDATAQAELVRSGDATPTDLVEAAIGRIETLDPELNAVIVPRFETARAEARAAPTDAPFRGVPYVIKDHALVTDGDLHAQGVAGLKEAGLRGDRDSWFVERMRAAGFVLVGKTNLPELALGPATEPRAFGPTRNPWDTSRSAGGSSGGSAAAVAAGFVPVAEGTDGGGSIRMPAGHCGVIGLKPTRGRISAGPGVTASDGAAGLGTEGLLARSVRDVAALLDIVSGRGPGDAYSAPCPRRPFADEVGADAGRMRIGVLARDPTGRASIDPACVAATRAAADLLSDAGHDVADAFPARLSGGPWPPEFLACIPTIVRREVARLGGLLGRPLTEQDVEPDTWALVLTPPITGAEYAAGVDSLRAYAAEIESWWERGWDLLLTPTTPTPPPPLGGAGGAPAPEAFTAPYNVSGQPAITVPLQRTANGLPVGVQLVAAWGREDVLVRVAGQLEAAAPWASRRPPLGL